MNLKTKTIDMTQAEKKARELLDRFLKEFPSTDDIGFGQIKIAKKCALICVDEMIKVLPSIYVTKDEEIHNGHSQYWEEVKQAIEKL